MIRIRMIWIAGLVILAVATLAVMAWSAFGSGLDEDAAVKFCAPYRVLAIDRGEVACDGPGVRKMNL